MNAELMDTDRLENCYYHSTTPSVNKCEICSQNVCVNCSKIFDKKMETSAYIERNVCPVCFYELTIKYYTGREERRGKIFLGIMILAVLVVSYFVPVTTLLFGSAEAPFLEPSIALIFLIPITLFLSGGLLSILRFLLKGPAYAEELKKRKNEFLAEVGMTIGSSKKI